MPASMPNAQIKALSLIMPIFHIIAMQVVAIPSAVRQTAGLSGSIPCHAR